MCPPIGSPLKSKLMSMYFPNLLELSLRFVLALPKASSTQLDFRRMFFTLQHKRKENGVSPDLQTQINDAFSFSGFSREFSNSREAL